MSEKTLEQELGDAFQKYMQAQNEYTGAVVDFMNGKFSYDGMRSEAIRDNDPKELGSNETLRSAAIDKLVAIPKLALNDREIVMKKKAGQLHIAEKRFSHFQMIAKLQIAGITGIEDG